MRTLRISPINLLPEDLKPKSDLLNFSNQWIAVWPVAALVLYFVSTTVYYQFSIHSKRNQIVTLETQEREIQAKLAPLKEHLESAQKSNERFIAMQAILSHKTGWSETFKEFSLLLPQGVWFTGLNGIYSESPKHFVVKGEALSQVKMADFLARLERSKLFGETVVVFSEKEPNVEPEIYRFELSVSIKDATEEGPS